VKFYANLARQINGALKFHGAQEIQLFSQRPALMEKFQFTLSWADHKWFVYFTKFAYGDKLRAILTFHKKLRKLEVKTFLQLTSNCNQSFIFYLSKSRHSPPRL
jgi:hypothetical protein